MKIVSKFSKSLIISLFVIGISIFTISSCDNISNTGTPDNKENPGNENDNSRYGTPCDKVLGNGNFVIHNFVGEKAGSLSNLSMAEDVNYYLGKGETYVKGLIDDFSESLQDNHTAQNYFASFVSQQKNNKFEKLDTKNSFNAYGIDETINGIAEPCFPIFEDFLLNIDNNRDRAIFIHSLQAFFNEEYFFGLGSYRGSETPLDEKYQKIRAEISRAWSGKTINKPFDIDQDIDQNNCLQITQELTRIIKNIAPKMGIKENHINQIINIAGVTYSLQAMDDRAAKDISHKTCNAKTNLEDYMWKKADEIFQNQQYQQAQTAERTY